MALAHEHTHTHIHNMDKTAKPSLKSLDENEVKMKYVYIEEMSLCENALIMYFLCSAVVRLCKKAVCLDCTYIFSIETP